MPIGIVLAALAWWKLAESRGKAPRLDLRGAVLVSMGLFGAVYGLVEGNAHGWTSSEVLGSFAGGAVGLAAFIWWELRTTDPMLPLRLFRNRAFTAVNVTAMLFSFGMFGSIFFLSQFLQTVQGYSPLGAGLRILPWTGIIMLFAPVVGVLVERWGAKRLVVTGLLLQSAALLWLSLIHIWAVPRCSRMNEPRSRQRSFGSVLTFVSVLLTRPNSRSKATRLSSASFG